MGKWGGEGGVCMLPTRVLSPCSPPGTQPLPRRLGKGRQKSRQTTGLRGLGVAGLAPSPGTHVPPPRHASPSTAAQRIFGKPGEHLQIGVAYQQFHRF